MKKRIIAGLLTVLAAAALFSGCKKKEDGRDAIRSFGGTTKGIMVYHDFSVGDVVFEDFDTEKYDAEEFRGYLEADINAYNDAHEFTAKPTETDKNGNVVYESKVTKPVEIVKLEAADNLLCQQLLYATTDDFVAYNEANDGALTKRGGITLQAGMLGEADSSLLANVFVDKDGKELDMEKFVNAKDFAEYRYAICDIESTLYVEGAIKGYCGGAYSGDYNCMSVPAGTRVIVLFK